VYGTQGVFPLIFVDIDGCYGALADPNVKVNSIALDVPYFCGCCGVVNRRGE
jgi:hypothetical protein